MPRPLADRPPVALTFRRDVAVELYRLAAEHAGYTQREAVIAESLDEFARALGCDRGGPSAAV